MNISSASSPECSDRQSKNTSLRPDRAELADPVRARAATMGVGVAPPSPCIMANGGDCISGSLGNNGPDEEPDALTVTSDVGDESYEE
mmetsp:Transcript_30218/g.65381  ORF Transcript_30218/g.65381 Transcript_30218/m.65381 type:complete len:88 (-) Transcript_30218:356-619(-)|eukprot:CAMPEP_0178665370 /NCGR_PEP_ID=MMETSP0698-20121128/29917_1 /TAXON_ID=265572 /ORGANISM="Extubocellulus spinifer, Strain CCMP396" /LENGTH=87 /DNA_ID=CAMNT_0020308679 /DNA_START=415 /DNA_END=678 /DNA_ORIENTATION=+